MAALTSFVRNLTRFSPFNTRACTLQYVRNNSNNAGNSNIMNVLSEENATRSLWNYRKDKYVDAKMLKDVKRRNSHRDYAALRPRLMAMKRCRDILPPEILMEADKVYNEKIPKTTCKFQLTNRCAMTSRSRGVLVRWRLSRFIFRHMVDYNRIAGLQRAMW